MDKKLDIKNRENEIISLFKFEEESPEERARFFQQMRGLDKIRDPQKMYRDALVKRHHLGKKRIVPASVGVPMPAAPPISGVSSWLQAGPNNGRGRIRELAIDPNNRDIIYAGTANGGVWKTINGGQTWKSQWFDQETMAIGALALAPSNPDILYVGTGEHWAGGFGYAGVGIYKTTNGGDSWSLIADLTSVNSTSFQRIAVNPTNPDHVYAAGQGGLFETVDGGTTWTRIENANHSDVLFRPDNADIRYRAVNGGLVYKWNIASGTWEEKSAGLPGPNGRIRLAISKSNPLVLYARLSSPAEVYKTIDGGENWTYAGNPDGTVSYVAYCNAIAVDPTDPDIAYAGSVNLYKTIDGGANWNMIMYWGYWETQPAYHADQHDLIFDPTDANTIFLANDGGISKSSDGGTNWKKISHGVYITQYYDLTGSKAVPSMFGGGTQDNGTFRSLGSLTWKFVSGGDGGFMAYDPNDPYKLYSESQNLNIRRSTNGGATMQWGGAGILNCDSKPFVGRLEHDPNLSDVLYAGTNRLYKTVDGAQSWNPLPVGHRVDIISNSTTGSPAGFTSTLQVDTVASTANVVLNFPDTLVSGSSGRSARLVAGNDGPYALADGMTLVISVDGGANQTVTFNSGDFSDITQARADEIAPVIASQLADASAYTTETSVFYAIGIAPSDSNRVYAGTSGRIWKSIDGGATWTDITVGTGAGTDTLPHGTVSRIAVDYTNANIVYFTLSYSSDSRRVFKSVDSGVTWQYIGGEAPGDLPDIPLSGIAVDPSNPSVLYVASDVGVFITSNGGISWADFSEGLPTNAVIDITVQEERKLLRCATHGRGTFQRTIHPLAANPDVDIYMCNNKLDTGEVFPGPSGVPDPVAVGMQVYWYESIDIKVDSPAYSVIDEIVDGVEFTEDIVSNAPLKGMVNRIFVRINNRGPFDTTNVTVKLLWADATGGVYPDLPADFWTSYPDDSADTTQWVPIGSFQTQAILEAAQPRVLRWDWQAPEVLPAEIAFLVVISSPDDPITTTQTVIADLVPNEKRTALLKVATAEAPIDLYIRDYLSDDGSIPSSGWAAQSPDIITRKDLVANPASEFGDINLQPINDKVEIGNDNYIYLRVLNRKPMVATAIVKVYYAPIAVSLIPSAWEEIGEITVADVPAGGHKVSDALVWPSVPDPGAIGHFCIIASIDNPEDPRPDPSSITDTASFLNYIKSYNNVSYRNVTFENILPDGTMPPMPFQLHNFDEEKSVDIEIDAVELPAGCEVTLRLVARLGLAEGVGYECAREIEARRTDVYSYFEILGGDRGFLRNLPFERNEDSQGVLQVHLAEDVVHDKVYPLRIIQHVENEPIGSITLFIRAMDLDKAPFVGVASSHLLHSGECKTVKLAALEHMRPFHSVKEGVINGFDLAQCCMNVYFTPREVSYRLAKITLEYINKVKTKEELQRRIQDTHRLGPEPGRSVGPKTAEHILSARDKLGGFRNVQQLDDVERIGRDTFADIINSFK